MTAIKKNTSSGTKPKRKENRGHLIVISAPSGAGKSTLCAAIRKRFPNILYSISSTTRKPREGEKDGIDYFFVTEEEFRAGIKNNQWAEWAKVHDNYYGTSAAYLNEHLSVNKDVLLDIDVQGADQIQQKYAGAISIFVLPPSLNELEQRLRKRGTDDENEIQKRLKNALEEIKKKERYQYIIVNDDLITSIDELSNIISQVCGLNISS